jgi:hypothetical protein
MRFLAVLILLAVLPVPIFSQHAPGDAREIRDPGRLLFAPLLAHHVEPRVGMSQLAGEGRLRLDIGNSIDLLRFDGMTDGDRMTIGADFFTWTSLRRERDFHFPVDAVDYLFGINAVYRHDPRADVSLSARLRLSHISAHLVDGSFDQTQRAWRDGDAPQVYSREFIDLIGACEYRDFLRVYAGGQYIYHVDPVDLAQFALQAGIEPVWRDALGRDVHLFAAYDLRILDAGAMRSAHALQSGIKLGGWRGAGLRIFIAYYHGPSQHGEYYDEMWSYWGTGFNIDF